MSKSSNENVRHEIKSKPKMTPEEKKAAREAKKEQKLKKKLERQNRYLLYDPGRMKGSAATITIGYALRFFAIAFSLFGVCELFCDAFMVPGVNWLPLLVYSFFAVSAFSLIFIGKWCTLAGFGMLGAYVGLFFAFAGNIASFYVSGAVELINQVMTRLKEAGFAAAGQIAVPAFGEVAEAIMPYGGIFAVATVLAIIFSAFSAKRTRLIPIVIFGGLLCVVSFTYNLCNSNWGIACVLAGVCSALVLSAYDKVYKDHKKSRKSRAYSGYAAALAGLLAMILVLPPALIASEPFTDIPVISEPMDDARTVITTVLTGGNPKYNKMNTLNRQTSAEIKDVEILGVNLFQVDSGARGKNVYLRSWIGENYDPGKDVWDVLDDGSYSAMRKKLKYDYGGFTGDDVTDMLYLIADPEYFNMPATKNYYSNNNFGAVATYVNVEYLENTGLLYVLPTVFDSCYTGLLAFETRDTSYRSSFSPYSDGMYRSSWLNLKKSYSALALIPTYTDDMYAHNSANMIEHYKCFRTFIANVRTADYGSAEEYAAAFKEYLGEKGVYGNGGIASYYYALTSNQQRDFYRRVVTLVDEYTEYVHSAYTSVTVTEGLEQAYAEVSDKADAAGTDHERIMTVINYLIGNCAYSLTPEKPTERHTSDVDAFLLETKEGYCVQFATAATLMLRMMGYPARYVQGYIASGFSSTSDENATLPFTTTVTDNEAHAWVEVYIDGLGWRPYETTPVYYLNIYAENSDLTKELDPYTEHTGIEYPDKDDPKDPVDPDKPDEPQDEDPGEEDPVEEPWYSAIDYALIIKILVSLAAAAGVAILVIWQIRRARRIVDGRSYFIDRAVYGTFEDEADRSRVAGVICDSIYEVHYIIMNRPRIGESPLQLADRVDHPEPTKKRSELKKRHRAAMRTYSFTAITVLLEKQEFGGDLTREELSTLGEYLRELTASEYRALNPFKKIWYRYIRFMI